MIATDLAEPKLTKPRESEPIAARPKRRRPFSTRGFASILLTVAFLALIFSGSILYVTPRGRVANWTDWTMLGLGKEQWGGLHINMSILFIVIALLHVALNWSRLVGYIKRRATSGLFMKKEMALAAVVSVLFIGGTLYELPPFHSVIALHGQIKNYWEVRTDQAPVPHAEQMTLAELSGHVGLAADDLAGALEAEGFDVSDSELTIQQIASQKQAAPNTVFAAVRRHYPGVSPGPGRGPGRGRGGQLSSDAHSASGSCSDSQGSCDNVGEPSAAGQAHEGPGQGRGWGRGLGRGRGMGMGLGQGPEAGGCSESDQEKAEDGRLMAED